MAANSSHEPDSYRVPLWLLVWGCVGTCGSALLAAREVWEETVWSWRYGPQMLGFSLAHGGGAILFLFPLLLLPWLAVALVVILYRFAKRRSVSRAVWATFGAAVTVFAVMALPYGLWQRLFADRLAHSAHAAEFLVYGAVDGDLGTVKALLAHGVPIDSRDREGKTALHGAAGRGQIKVLDYLLSRSADLNAVDRFGDSPLEKAAAASQNEAVQLLSGRGAKRIRGDDAQRQKAVEDIVREDIERRR